MTRASRRRGGRPGTLDFGTPVAITMLGVLQLVPDEDDPYAIAATLAGALCPGSYLVLSHPTSEIDTEAMTEMARRLNERSAPAQMTLRTHEQINRFFDGLEMVEPGLVPVNRWRPDVGDVMPDSDVPNYCGVACKAGAADSHQAVGSATGPSCFWPSRLSPRLS